jgi:hypothetical protein
MFGAGMCGRGLNRNEQRAASKGGACLFVASNRGGCSVQQQGWVRVGEPAVGASASLI